MSCVLISPPGMDGVNYHEYASGVYYSPVAPPMPPSETMSFNSSFSSQPEYIVGPYSTTSSFDGIDGCGQPNQSFNEHFTHQHTESFNVPINNHPANAMGIVQAPASPPMATRHAAVPISPSQVVPRQKAKRTPTACEECRKRKQKCDGETPCQGCKEQKLLCRYREVSPTKKDNTLEKLMSLVETYSKTLVTLSERLDSMGCTLRQIEQRLTRCWQCGSTVELSTGHCDGCGRISCAVQTADNLAQK